MWNFHETLNSLVIQAQCVCFAYFPLALQSFFHPSNSPLIETAQGEMVGILSE